MIANGMELTAVFTTLVILLLLCGVVITVFIANRRNINQQVKIARMEADYEKELRQAEHEVQEKVLANVARELHDNLGQRLTVVKMHIERHKIIHRDLATEIEPITTDVDHAISELRQISKSLNSDLLENGGLLQAMQQEVGRLKKIADIDVHWIGDTEPGLAKDARVMMFRIFQEVLNNLLKHAGCRNVYIEAKAADGFYMEIRDDGRGFDVDEKMASGSGLRNMIKRADIANIKSEVLSEPGKGTTWRFTQIK